MCIYHYMQIYDMMYYMYLLIYIYISLSLKQSEASVFSDDIEEILVSLPIRESVRAGGIPQNARSQGQGPRLRW